jgi:hypothetical protein
MSQVAYVMRAAGRGGDCTNGGISSRAPYLTVFGHDEPFKPGDFTFCGEPAPPVRLRPSNLRSPAAPPHLVPIDPETGEKCPGWFMFGGNVATCSDSRFGEMVERVSPGFQYVAAVSIHDRQE